MKKNKNNTTQL